MITKISPKSYKQIGCLVGIIFIAAFSRILPHPYNFSPIVAMGIFGAAFFERKWLAFVVPFFALFLSDLVLNNLVYAHINPSFTLFYKGFYWQYIAYAIIIGAAIFTMKSVTVKNTIGTSLFASILFFVFSNLGVWATSGMYAPNWSGLATCYAAAIPFFPATLIGDLFYCGILFGAYLGVEKLVFNRQIAK